MIHILFFILQIILAVVLFSLMILFALWSIGNLKNQVPFVAASGAILKDIGETLNVGDDSTVYDLGCGDGRVLLFLSKLNSKAKYIGIENNIFAVLLSKVGAYLNKRKTGADIEIIKNDFFKQNLGNATHVFIYLYPSIMDELLPKFEKEFKSGTRLVSLSFKFTTKNPISEIDLGRNKYKLGRKLYVYQF